jgi:hypothetical protein
MHRCDADAARQQNREPQQRFFPPGRLRVRVEIMGSHKYRNVGKSQGGLIMINPIIFHPAACLPPVRTAQPAAGFVGDRRRIGRGTDSESAPPPLPPWAAISIEAPWTSITSDSRWHSLWRARRLNQMAVSLTSAGVLAPVWGAPVCHRPNRHGLGHAPAMGAALPGHSPHRAIGAAGSAAG